MNQPSTDTMMHLLEAERVAPYHNGRGTPLADRIRIALETIRTAGLDHEVAEHLFTRTRYVSSREVSLLWNKVGNEIDVWCARRGFNRQSDVRFFQILKEHHIQDLFQASGWSGRNDPEGEPAHDCVERIWEATRNVLEARDDSLPSLRQLSERRVWILLWDQSFSGQTVRKELQRMRALAQLLPLGREPELLIAHAMLASEVRDELAKTLGSDDRVIAGELLGPRFRAQTTQSEMMSATRIGSFLDEFSQAFFPRGPARSKLRDVGAWGYKNGGWLITLEHNCPNNSIPPLWLDTEQESPENVSRSFRGPFARIPSRTTHTSTTNPQRIEEVSQGTQQAYRAALRYYMQSTSFGISSAQEERYWHEDAIVGLGHASRFDSGHREHARRTADRLDALPHNSLLPRHRILKARASLIRAHLAVYNWDADDALQHWIRALLWATGMPTRLAREDRNAIVEASLAVTRAFAGSARCNDAQRIIGHLEPLFPGWRDPESDLYDRVLHGRYAWADFMVCLLRACMSDDFLPDWGPAQDRALAIVEINRGHRLDEARGYSALARVAAHRGDPTQHQRWADQHAACLPDVIEAAFMANTRVILLRRTEQWSVLIDTPPPEVQNDFRWLRACYWRDHGLAHAASGRMDQAEQDWSVGMAETPQRHGLVGVPMFSLSRIAAAVRYYPESFNRELLRFEEALHGWELRSAREHLYTIFMKYREKPPTWDEVMRDLSRIPY